MSVTKRQTVLFGHYLMARGLISRGDISRALRLQREHTRETEQLVRRTGLLSEEQMKDIRGFREGHLYFGEALVKLGVMPRADMLQRLDEFRKERPETDLSRE
jgi:hypothetical protein